LQSIKNEFLEKEIFKKNGMDKDILSSELIDEDASLRKNDIKIKKV
jgi:hypothetical protein